MGIPWFQAKLQVPATVTNSYKKISNLPRNSFFFWNDFLRKQDVIEPGLWENSRITPTANFFYSQ